MAAANAYRVKSVTWKATAVTGIVDVNQTDTNEGVTKHRTDNATTVQAIFLDGIGATVTMTTTNEAIRALAAYALGQTGALVVVRELRAKGIGASAGDLTATYADACVVSVREGTPIAGRGTIEVTWECVDPAGTAVVVHT